LAKAADVRIDEFEKRLKAMKPGDDPADAQRDLETLLASPCLQLAASDKPSGKPDSALALQRWWEDGGGWWVRHHLQLKTPHGPNQAPMGVVSPTIRTTLTLETRPGHPLRSIMCSVHDSPCGGETAGWHMRATQFFADFAEKQRGAWLNGDQKSDAPKSLHRCDTDVLRAPAAERYGAWRRCLRESRAYGAQFPIGNTRAPTSGWLLLRGRRGHYSFCDGVRAYDLATGSAYIAESCSGLALNHNGSVNGRATDAGRKDQVRAGTLPLDALREAAWMLLLASEVQSDVTTSWGTYIPKGVEPRDPNTYVFGLGMSHSFSSGQTTLGFSAMLDAGPPVTGSLTWPEDMNHPGYQHAARLLHVAEAGLVPGCPSAAPPKTLDFGASKSAVSGLDADPAALKKVHQELLGTMTNIQRDVCKGTPARSGGASWPR
jgi:hypothetical protein